MQPHATNLLLLAALSATSLTAQTTTYFSPSGTKTIEGNSMNTIPWWAGSGSYQQVHDSSDLTKVFPLPAVMIKGISIRKEGTAGSAAGRNMDVELTVSTTPISAAAATTTFASNHGAAPTVVLPYTNVSLPALIQIGRPNPQGWYFYFATPFSYLVPTGNLCWELRFKNSSTIGGTFDVCTGGQAFNQPLIGAGCIATGQTLPATISTRLFTIATGVYRNTLTRGPASSPASMFIGDQAQHLVFPGFCSAVETLPVISIPGTTSASGTWDLSLTIPGFPAATPFYAHAQFVFLDTGLPNAVGVSDCSPIGVPALSYQSMCRIHYYYSTISGSGQGNEVATTGTKDASYGFVTGFEL